jgi:predicted nucleotidyltransferase component of viral defense system
MITPGYLAQHAGPARGSRDIALLDICQDYALDLLNTEGAFGLGVVLKGGTSLRKFRAGNAGRFSTDLDFATPDVTTAELVMDILDGADHYDIQMRVTDKEELRARIEFQTPLGQPTVPAKLELSPRPLWLPTPLTAPITLPVHKGYEFVPAALPVPTREESIAEKLAAWRRRRKMRDLYDLYWQGGHMFDEQLVRRLFVLKVWHDVVDDGLGPAPLDPAEVVTPFDATKMPTEEIGLLTQPVQPEVWARFVCERFTFITSLDDDERRAARCSPGDAYFVSGLVANLVSG